MFEIKIYHAHFNYKEKNIQLLFYFLMKYGRVIFEVNSTEEKSMMESWRSPTYTTDFLRVLGVQSSCTVPYRLHRWTPSLPAISFVDVNNISTKSVYAQFRKYFLHNDLLLQSSLIKDMSYIRVNGSWTGILQAFRSPEIYKRSTCCLSPLATYYCAQWSPLILFHMLWCVSCYHAYRIKNSFLYFYQ